MYIRNKSEPYSRASSRDRLKTVIFNMTFNMLLNRNNGVEIFD